MSTATTTATVPATPAMFSVAGLPSWVIDGAVLAQVKDGLNQARVRPETTLAWCQAFLVGRPVDLAGFNLLAVKTLCGTINTIGLLPWEGRDVCVQ